MALSGKYGKLSIPRVGDNTRHLVDSDKREQNVKRWHTNRKNIRDIY